MISFFSSFLFSIEERGQMNVYISSISFIEVLLLPLHGQKTKERERGEGEGEGKGDKQT